MLRYVLKRLLLALPTLFLVALAVFFLVRLIPGDPAQVMLGEGADPAAIAALRIELGLDRPLPVQFFAWLGQVLQGDLGTSIVTGEPVTGLVLTRFELTATVVMIAVALATCIAVLFGLLAAWRRNRRLDWAVNGAASLVLAVPSFWLGLVLLLVFGVTLRWLPVVGYLPVSEGGLAALLFLVLPIVTLTISESGVLTRMMRSSAIDVLSLDYVTHARAKGLRESVVLRRHVFPNAFAPTLTLVGLTLGHLLGGVAVIETVFTLPGLGRLMVNAVLSRDYPVVQGCLLFTAFVYVLINLIVDLLYPLFDPRVTAA
ncbi:ABC transporter permease [Sphingomonas sp. JC676]|uniref:ABC transporter permease n=1 Tax=Sphingomonas sp. JC676 TaxID=2768065 RepID=UPI001657B626|nr:ABC transporter permease [Sphingomonas sp. JC676]MBC9033743.1 ABC transporter permease [Sphingomonas sp. JC676]